jgi:hypothetical protein
MSVTHLFGKDAPITVNEQGGMQSKTAGAFYQLPARAIAALRYTCVEEHTYHGHLGRAWDCITAILADNHDANYLRLAFVHLAFAHEAGEPQSLGGGVFVGTMTTGGFPASALVKIAEVMDEGAKRYARGNWRRIPYWSQIDHVVQHLTAHAMGDTSDDHIGHALTRLAFAIEVEDVDYRFTEIEEVKTPSEKRAELLTGNGAPSFVSFSVGEVDQCAASLRALDDVAFSTLCDAMTEEFKRRGLPDIPFVDIDED